MAVDKMELLKRYKELKAQGVNISLMELKKQMGVNDATNHGETTQAADGLGVNTITNNTQNTQAAGLTQSSTYNKTGFSALNTQPARTQNTTTQITSPSAYSGNITSQNVEKSNYTNNFSGNFGFGENQQPQSQAIQSQPQQISQPTQPYYGNITTENRVQEQDPQVVQKYCVIGYPLGHSLSGYIHSAGFKSLGINARYEVLETPPDSLVDRIKYLKANNYSGFNVTIPLKLPVTLFLDEVDASADIVNAVNTVVINPENKTMKGYNTDVLGFRNAISDDITLPGKTCAILGTGGAARAAITALAQNQVKSIKLFTRNVPNSLELLNFLRERFPNVEFNALQIERIRDLSDIEILVNTTPIGMQGRAADLTPVEENELRTLPQGALVYDVIYNPKKTILLKLAQKYGYKTINGVDMFIHQALASEQIWTGRTPDFKDMKIAALENL